MNLIKYTFIQPQFINQTYQKIIKCFQNFLPLNIIYKILQKNVSLEELDDVIEVIVNDEDFISSETECEVYDNIDELKNAQEYDGEKHSKIILDDLSKDQLNDKRIQMLFKREKHNNLSVFVITHGFYELPKDTIRENSIIIHHFITSNYSNIECIHRQLCSTDMKIHEFKNFAMMFG